jgi:hypothetical protein
MRTVAFLVLALLGLATFALSAIWAPPGAAESLAYRVAWGGQLLAVLAGVAGSRRIPGEGFVSASLRSAAMPVVALWLPLGAALALFAQVLSWRVIASAHALAFTVWAIVSVVASAAAKGLDRPAT